MHALKLQLALLMAAACFSSADANAGAAQLTPCNNGADEYYARVEALAHKAAPKDALWKITVFPSNQAEWSLRATRRGDGYELTVVRFERSVWAAGWVKAGPNEMRNDPSKARARAQVTTHEISARLFNELDSAFRRAIEAARPDDSNEIVLDGVNFRFEVPGLGCGETGSFDRETPAGKLLAIAMALCKPDEDEILRMLAALPPSAG